MVINVLRVCSARYMIKHLEFRNEQSDVFIIWVYGDETYSAKEITGIFSSIFSVMYVCVCVCVHTLTRCLDLILRSFFLTGIQILEISSSSHSRRGNKVQISPFSPWNRHERPLLTESDPICSRCAARDAKTADSDREWCVKAMKATLRSIGTINHILRRNHRSLPHSGRTKIPKSQRKRVWKIHRTRS